MPAKINKVLILQDLKYYEMKATQKIKSKLNSLGENDTSVSTQSNKKANKNDIDNVKQEIIDEFDSLH